MSAFLGHDLIALHSIQPSEQFTSGIPKPVDGDSIAQASNKARRFIRVSFELPSDIGFYPTS